MEKRLYIAKSEYCVICGKEIPEGGQVCPECENAVDIKIITSAERDKSVRHRMTLLKRIFKEY